MVNGSALDEFLDLMNWSSVEPFGKRLVIPILALNWLCLLGPWTLWKLSLLLLFIG
jgi:hypothetical protein